jgi:signal transduction histidine kinase
MNKDATTILKKEIGRLRITLFLLLILGVVLQVIVFYAVFAFVFREEPMAWTIELGIATASFVIFGVLIVSSLSGTRLQKQMHRSIGSEMQEMRAATNRAKVLQTMASTLSATLSFERVMEVALDVCSLALEEMGIPSRSLVGAVFLYDGDELAPVAARRFVARDMEKRILGREGIIGQALNEAEPIISKKAAHDPELQLFAALKSCRCLACLPLRAGFQIYGAMVIGTETDADFDHTHLELFKAVADQAVIALQNAQLYQKLESEKQRIIEADEEARKELARDLHDGPTQSVAAIAMRINFITTLLAKNPRQALVELKKVEDLAKQTSKEIRAMLFALRPLVLETQGLGAAVETAMNKLRESDGLNLRLVGGEYGDLLDERAQGTVFYIIEEALGNARKYSKANLVEVRLWREGGLFVARIRDDGVGFDTAAVNTNYSSRGSLGMVNMRERAERIDGSLKVESAPGKGTAVTLVVPLEKHGRKE